MDMTEHADQSVNTTTMVKEYTNPLKAPIDNDINLFDFLDQRASRDPEGSMVDTRAKTAVGTPSPHANSVRKSSTSPKA